MSRRTFNAASKSRGHVLAMLALAGAAACGGSQQPAESPEAVPNTAPAPDTPANDASSAPAGEHTMPDGTKMEGHEHGAGSDEHQH